MNKKEEKWRIQAIREGEDIEMCREQCCKGCTRTCGFRCGQVYGVKEQ